MNAKRFSHSQAAALIPTVDILLTSIQATLQEAYTLRLRLENLEPLSIEARNLQQELLFLFRIACSYSDELGNLGVLLEDAEAGIVAFPSDCEPFQMTRYTWRKGDADITKTQGISYIDPKPSSVSF